MWSIYVIDLCGRFALSFCATDLCAMTHLDGAPTRQPLVAICSKMAFLFLNIFFAELG
jgi:hypothetical protein